MKYKLPLLIGMVTVLGLGLILIIFTGKPNDKLVKYPAATNQATPTPILETTPIELPTPTPETSEIPEVSNETTVPTPEVTVQPSETGDDAPVADSEEWFNAIGDRKDIPLLDVPVDSNDLTMSVFENSNEVEMKYLSDTLKQELAETVLSSGQRKEAVFPNQQSYSIEWYVSDDFEKLIPEMPLAVPLYAIARDKDTKVFEKVKKIVQDFGIKATVLRMNETNYSAFDMNTGDNLLGYDISKDIFEIPKLKIPMTGKETPMNSLEWFLYEKGLLRYPYHAVYLENIDGSKVVSFEPDLELPIIRFDSIEAQGNSVNDGNEPYLVGVGETIDGVIDREGNLRELYAFFPNLEKWSDLSLMSAPQIAQLFKEGQFAYADVQLQNPAALPIDQRQTFYDMAKEQDINITEAELYEVECGYFQEAEKNYQLFYQPVCMAYGDGYVGDYAVTFGAVLSIAK